MSKKTYAWPYSWAEILITLGIGKIHLGAAVYLQEHLHWLVGFYGGIFVLFGVALLFTRLMLHKEA